MRIRFILTLLALAALIIGGMSLLRTYNERNTLSTAYAAGVAFQDAKDWEHAREQFQRVLAIDPNYGDTAARLTTVERAGQIQQADELYPQAVALLSAQKWKASADLFSQIIALDPAYRDVATLLAQARASQTDLETHYTRGVAAFDAQRWTEALTELRAALKLLGGAELPSQRIDVEKRIAQAEQQLGLEEHYTAAINHLQAGRIREARDEFWKIIALDPEYRDVSDQMIRTARDAWPAFRRTAAHDARLNLSEPVGEKPQAIWEYQTPGFILASPALLHGQIYAPSGDGKLYVLNAATGQLRWSLGVGAAINSSPAISGTSIYFGADDGAVYALDTSGSKRWRVQTNDKISAAPAVEGNMVYVASNDGKIYALDAVSGNQRWATQTGGALRSSPAVSGTMLYVGAGDGGLYALNTTTGAILWAAPTGGAVNSSPAISGGMVYAGSDGGSIYALDAVSGTVRWRAETGGAVSSSPLLAGDLLVVGSADGKVYGLDARNGKQIWVYPTGNAVLSSPVLVDGRIYVGNEDAHLYALDPKNGAMLWSAETRGVISTQPVAGDGILIVASYDGKVHGYH